MSPRPPKERRSATRVATDNKTTGLVQKILEDPAKAADELEGEIRTTGDVTMVSALIWAAESVAKLRGIDLTKQVAAVRRRLKDAGFEL